MHEPCQCLIPLGAKRIREVANLTESKNLHTPVYGVKEFVRLYVTNFDPNYLATGQTEWAEIFFRKSMAKTHISIFLFVHKGADRAGAND